MTDICGRRYVKTQKEQKLYGVWTALKKRCLNPNDPSYADYGGRGITVCEEWRQSFWKFYDDMQEGWALGLRIDRKENDGPYDKNNCRWVTASESNLNRRKPRRFVPYWKETAQTPEVQKIVDIS